MSLSSFKYYLLKMATALNALVNTGGRAPTRLGELLVASGRLSGRDLDRALGAQQELGGMLGRVLVRLGLVSERDVALGVGEQLGFQFVEGEEFPGLVPDVPGLLDRKSVV